MCGVWVCGVGSLGDIHVSQVQLCAAVVCSSPFCRLCWPVISVSAAVLSGSAQGNFSSLSRWGSDNQSKMNEVVVNQGTDSPMQRMTMH